MRNSLGIKQLSGLLSLLLLTLLPVTAVAKLVIAQGGASGYITPGSQPAVTLAVAMGADIIKLDTVLTKDDVVLVLSSPDITSSTNIAQYFPERMRKDGKFYVFDFTLEEMQRLSLSSPVAQLQGTAPLLAIQTLQEEISLIRTLNRSLGKDSHMAIELRQPWIHRKENKDLSLAVLKVLQKTGSTGMAGVDTDILSYDALELRRIRKELGPNMGVAVNLIQLIESNEGRENMVEEWGEWVSYNYDWMFSKSGLRSLSASVAAIGFPKGMLVDTDGNLLLTDFVKTAQQLGTMIFTYSVTEDSHRQFSFLNSFEEELEFFYFTVGVDGVATDLCREARSYLKTRQHTAPATFETDAGSSQDPLQLTNPSGLSKEE
jgi:glycerophosphoryl diester phosphodiesterase